jgi:hypothetical protein
MKLFILVFSTIIFYSCGTPAANRPEINKHNVSVVELYNGGYCEISIITIDSVEYIMGENYKGGISITPKIKK